VLVTRRGYSAKVAKVLSLFSSLWDLFSEFNFGRLSNEVLSLTGRCVCALPVNFNVHLKYSKAESRHLDVHFPPIMVIP
jgi:hypothetical protein